MIYHVTQSGELYALNVNSLIALLLIQGRSGLVIKSFPQFILDRVEQP